MLPWVTTAHVNVSLFRMFVFQYEVSEKQYELTKKRNDKALQK